MTPLERITARIAKVGDPNDPSAPFALLSLSEFFDGNEIDGSIGCNLDPMPSPLEFYEFLRTIEARPTVDRVHVQITAFDDPDWPFSDTVWISTTASEEEVRAWFPDELEPNEVWTGWIESQKYEEIIIPNGYNVIACWWD